MKYPTWEMDSEGWEMLSDYPLEKIFAADSMLNKIQSMQTPGVNMFDVLSQLLNRLENTTSLSMLSLDFPTTVDI